MEQFSAFTGKHTGIRVSKQTVLLPSIKQASTLASLYLSYIAFYGNIDKMRKLAWSSHKMLYFLALLLLPYAGMFILFSFLKVCSMHVKVRFS